MGDAEVWSLTLSLVLVAPNLAAIVVAIVDVYNALIIVVIWLTVKSDQTLTIMRYL